MFSPIFFKGVMGSHTKSHTTQMSTEIATLQKQVGDLTDMVKMLVEKKQKKTSDGATKA